MKDKQVAQATTTRNPWLWIPTLYFAEGIPYFIVNNISVLMLAKMGVPNGQMALFTSLLYRRGPSSRSGAHLLILSRPSAGG